MRSVVILDCEFNVSAGAPGRFWCGPNDPDPVVLAIAAVKLTMDEGLSEGGVFERKIVPRDRSGKRIDPEPFFCKFVGVSADDFANGVELADALHDFSAFVGDCAIWSWGLDELNLMATSSYVAGISPTVPAHQFGNATRLLQVAGIALEEILALRSNTLPQYFGLEPPGRAHDPLADARSVALVLRHLVARGQLELIYLTQPQNRY